MKILAGILSLVLIWFIYIAISQPVIDKDPDNLNDNWF